MERFHMLFRAVNTYLLLCAIGLSVLLPLTAASADDPRWWQDRGIVTTNGAVNDYAAANHGQLKFIATQAYTEFDDKLEGADLSAISNMVDGFVSAADYAALNQGQLKNAAAPFYDVLWDNGLTNAWPNGMIDGPYPWSSSPPSDDYALANIGQLQYAFSFDVSDLDGDGLADAWEMQYFGSLNESGSGDFDLDGVSNLTEFVRGIDPTNKHEVTREIHSTVFQYDPSSKTLIEAGDSNDLYIYNRSGLIGPYSTLTKLNSFSPDELVQQDQFNMLRGGALYITNNLVYYHSYFWNENGITPDDRIPHPAAMSILDISLDPPEEISKIEFEGLPKFDSIIIRDSYGYSGQSLVGFYAFDFSDLNQIECTYTNNSVGFISEYFIEGDQLYIASFNKGLLIFDVSNPSTPVQIGQFNTRSCFRDVYVKGSIAYAADGINGLLVIDVSNPAKPVLLEQLELEYGRSIECSGNQLCMLGYKSIYFIDISDPIQPILRQEISLGDNEPLDVCATSGLFHIIDSSNVLHSYYIP